MSKTPKRGPCKLCGRFSILTYEHVPPRCAFNDTPVRMVNGSDYLKNINSYDLPWDFSRLRGKVSQRGKGGYYLCSSCNAQTGAWYVPFFEQFIRGVYGAIASEYVKEDACDAIHLIAESIRPLPIFKEIMVMFCDINENCFGDENLRSFLLEKDSSIIFDCKKYRVFCYIAKGPIFRMNGLSVSIYNAFENNVKHLVISEISSMPLGFALYIDLPEDYIPKGCEITHFSQYRYNDTVRCEMTVPLLESNILFSGDYRTKDEIENTLKQSRLREMNERLKKKIHLR